MNVWISDGYDDLDSIPKSFSIYKCDECGRDEEVYQDEPKPIRCYCGGLFFLWDEVTF